MLRRCLCLFCMLSALFFLLGFCFLPEGRLPTLGEAVFARGNGPYVLPQFSPFPLAPVVKKEMPSGETPPPASPEKVVPPDVFEASPAVENGVLAVQNSAGYSFDRAALLASPFSLLSESPRVLLLHTHTSEAYTESDGFSYTPSDVFRTEDQAFNICRVGSAMAEILRARGITVVHDTTSHDYPSYSGCYARSLETIEKNIAESGAFDLVIDMHRDAISDESGRYLKTACEVEGKTAAQALLVIGTDAGGLPHDTWQENLALGLKIQKTLSEMHPGLMRPLHLRKERFNGHAAHGALLLEIGSCGNTMEEALYTAELVGEALADFLLSYTV